MTMKNKTRRALVLSVLSLILCCSMLVGTTFAWFTDSEIAVNTIQAGNLDIALYYAPAVDANGNPVTSVADDAWLPVEPSTSLFNENALWEPGHVQAVYLKAVNEGTLALKYQMGVNVANETPSQNVLGGEFKLSDYLMVDMELSKTLNTYSSREDAATDEYGSWPIPGMPSFHKKLSAMKLDESHLLPGDTVYASIAVYMPTSVGNEANYAKGAAVPTIQMGVIVNATQYTYENDSYGNDYDADATFDAVDTFVAAGDSKALQDAIAAGDKDGNGKAIIQLGAGEFDADLYVVPTDRNLIINGQGADTKLNFKKGQVRLVQFDSLTINNCTIGRMVDKSWGQLVFSTSVAGGNYTISNCIFEGKATQGIYINQDVPATFNIKNCTFNGDFGSEGAITVQNNDGVDITVNVTDCDFNNIPATSHEIFVKYAYNGWTLNAEGVNAYWATNP